jgi:lipopolysaccharide transport protein LptA
MSKENSVKRSTFYKRVAAMSAFLVLTGLNMAFAQQKTVADPGRLSDAPLHITANKMVAYQKEGMVEFTGNVKAVQDGAVLLAQSIKIYLYPSDKNTGDTQEQNQVKKIVAAQNVEYTARDRKAFADQAVYTADDDILVLTGESARLLTGTSWVTGTRITLFRKEDRAMVESEGSTRVQALFNPDDQPAAQ